MAERQVTLPTIALATCVATAFFVCGSSWLGWPWLYFVPFARSVSPAHAISQIRDATPVWIPLLFGWIGAVGLRSLTRVASGRTESPVANAVLVAALLGCALLLTSVIHLVSTSGG